MSQKPISGYLPDEAPPIGKLIVFALQQILVMFPATVLVALLTGFDISTTIFASGLATLCFVFITKGQIPLYYGSSFSYIAAICSLQAKYLLTDGSLDTATYIRSAQFGIVMSGLVSIVVGLIIHRFGRKLVEKILPATVTGPIALVIGVSLAGVAINNASGYTNNVPSDIANVNWIISIFTLLVTIALSVYLKKGVWGQLPMLFGVLLGYALASIVTLTTDYKIIDFAAIGNANLLAVPKFTLPLPNWVSVAAIMPIAIATIPESTAHLFQLDLYVNDLAKKKGVTKKYTISDKLGLNLIGDGVGDIVSGMIGGPAGTNYGENLSTMAITRNFSIKMLSTAAIITMVLSFSGTLSGAVSSIPNCVIGGLGIFLFGVIGAQGVAIMIEKKVDVFEARSLAVIAVILVIGIGGSYLPNGQLNIFGMQLPAIATAAIVGIVLNLLLSFKGKEKA